jgi:MFS superfamily sulfate permease-like transporter
MFFSSLLAGLPQPVLAAVVLVAVAGLFNVSALKHLWRANRQEFLVAMAAIVGVLGQGLLRGVMIGAIISMVLLIRRTSRPHVAFLGRIAGTRRFSDRERHPDNELIPGVLIFRPESSLVYFNMDHVRDTISERVRAEATTPRLVVLDLSAAPHVDMHGAQMLAELAEELTSLGVRVQAVEARSSVRESLRKEGVEDKIGGVNRFTSVADVVEGMPKQSTT